MLELTNVAVRYRGGALGIEDVSLTGEPGQLVLVSGANGAGKTSTLRALTGFLRSERARVVRGSVRLDGRDVTNWEPHRLNQVGITIVPERRKIFPNMSVKENLYALGRLPPRRVRAERTEEALSLFPELKPRMRELAGRLSGGQQQMLAIARTLLGDARVVAVDEPTLGLHHSLYVPVYKALRAVASTGRMVIVADESAGAGGEYADKVLGIVSGIIRPDEPAGATPAPGTSAEDLS